MMRTRRWTSRGFPMASGGLVSLAVTVALVACKPDPVVTPGDGPEETPGQGLDKGAMAPPGEIPEVGVTPDFRPDGAPRERPKPADVADVDGALKALATGNPEGAAKFLASAAKDKPKDVRIAQALARAQWEIGQYDEAEKTLTAIRKSAKGADAVAVLRHLSDIRMRRGDPKAARKHLDAALKASPGDVPTTGQMADLLYATGQRKNDAELARIIDALYDAYDAGAVKSAADHLAVGKGTLAQGGRGGFKDANMVLHEAEQLEPVAKGTPLADEIFLRHAAIFREKYNTGEASNTLSMILERNPWHVDALTLQAYVMLDDFRLADAHRTASEVLLVDPKNPGAHAALARIAAIEGRRSEARKRVVDHVLPVNPLHTEGLAVLASISVFENDKAAYATAEKAAQQLDPKAAGFYSVLGAILSFLHLYPEEDEILDKARKLSPNDPYINSEFGLNRMRLGDDGVGLPAVELAYKKDRFNERTLNTIELYDQRITPHYTEKKRGDLTVRLPTEGKEVVVEDVMDILQQARSTLDKRYGIKPSPQRFEVYESFEDFSVRTVGVPSLGAVGVCFGPNITSVGPYGGTHNFHTVAWHELAHVYAITLSKGRVPRWFTEGLSEWESELHDPSWARESAKLLRAARDRGKLRKLSELELAFLRAGSAVMMEVAYSEAAYVMRYLGTTYGVKKIVKMLEGYAEGKHTEELFPKVLGKSLLEVEKEFDAWFNKELDAAISGWSPDPERKGDKRDEAYHDAFTKAREGNTAEAEKAVQALIQAGGDGYETRMLLSQILLQGPARDSAVKHLQKAATFNKEATDPHQALAALAREKGDSAAEITALTATVAIDSVAPTEAVRLAALGMITKNDKAVARGTDRLMAVAPLSPEALAAQAWRTAKKKPAFAKMLLERYATAAQGAGPDANRDTIAAFAHRKAGDAAAAKQHAGSALKADPDPALKAALGPLAK